MPETTASAKAPRATTQIRLGPVAGRGKDDSIIVNGHDITTSVVSVALAVKPGDITQVELGIFADDGLGIETEADIRLTGSTRDALVSLGWTPPADEA
jgi:hypothetical protein